MKNDARLRQWVGWALRLLLAVAGGTLLAYIAVYRVSPYYRSTERLLAAWAGENQRVQMRDNYLLLAYLRLRPRILDNDHRFLVPVLLPTLVRAGHYADVDWLLQHLSAKERSSPTFVQAIVISLEELARANRPDLMKKYRLLLGDLWRDNIVIRKYARYFDEVLALADWRDSFQSVANRLEADLRRRPLAGDDPRLARLRELLANSPAETQETFGGLRGYRQQAMADAILFLERAIGYQPGALDQFGDLLVSAVTASNEVLPVVQGVNNSLTHIQNTPARWPEWQRFTTRLAGTTNPGLRCLHDYSQGFLFFALHHDNRQAADLLTRGVAQQPVCGSIMGNNARAILSHMSRGSAPDAKPPPAASRPPPKR